MLTSVNNVAFGMKIVQGQEEAMENNGEDLRREPANWIPVKQRVGAFP